MERIEDKCEHGKLVWANFGDGIVRHFHDSGYPLMEICDKYKVSHRSIAEIQAELDAAKEAERKRLAKKVKAIVPIYKFTLTKTQDAYILRQMMNPSCTPYTLFGEILNKEELSRVGKPAIDGGMTYIFNNYSGQFVIAIGGGTIHLRNQEGWDELSNFIYECPEGGDVTDIVNTHRKNDVNRW